MTIRLKCAECRRKLKVPDEALGKKVQCPVCGARFLGYLDAGSPPAVEAASVPSPFPSLELEEPAKESATPEFEGLDPIVLEDEPLVEVAEDADEVDVVEEFDDEDEEAESGKSRPKNKKSRKKLLIVCLAGIGLVILLACGGVGFAAYRFWFGE